MLRQFSSAARLRSASASSRVFFRVVVEAQEGGSGHSFIFQIARNELRCAGVWSQLAAAGDDTWGPAGVEQFGRTGSAVAGEVVVPDHHDDIGVFERVLHNPEVAGDP